MKSNSKELKDYAPPGKLVDVDGHRMHFYSTGTGTPTVVVDCGIGDYTLGWSLVQPEVAKFTRICTYDRSGYGWSDPRPGPCTSQQAVDELHTLLVNAGVEGPYVLVGHSFGRVNVRLFANQYPDEVVGMVLVDAGHEDQWERLPSAAVKIQQANENVWKMLSTLSKIKMMKLVGKMIGPPPIIQQLPEQIRPMYLAGFTGTYFDTMLDEFSALDESFDQIRITGSLGDIPLIVLTGGNFLDLSKVKLPPSFPMEESQRAWINMQSELAGLSSSGKHIVAQNCGHGFATEKPELVVDAIRQVVEAVNSKGAL